MFCPICVENIKNVELFKKETQGSSWITCTNRYKTSSRKRKLTPHRNIYIAVNALHLTDVQLHHL